MKIRNYIYAFALGGITATTVLTPAHAKIADNTVTDTFKRSVPPEGTADINVLKNAPSSEVVVKGEKKYAKLVVDIKNNTLYKYDENGNPLKAYLVATGKKGTRTKPRLSIVSHKEDYPYSCAPGSKRSRNPKAYGNHILILNILDPKTGKQSSTGQFVHGNDGKNDEECLGKKVSLGCVRTKNSVMDNELYYEVVRGDLVLFMNPDID